MKTKLGATGRFPDGKLNEHDKGELVFAIGRKGELVHIDFGKSVRSIAVPPSVAINIARALLEHAQGEPLEVLDEGSN